MFTSQEARVSSKGEQGKLNNLTSPIKCIMDITRKVGRGHATPHMPVETAKCWWLLKIEPNVWAGGKGSCAVCVDLQAVGTLEFFGELYSLAKGRFGPFLRGFGQTLEKGRVLFLVTTSTWPSLQAYAELHALSPLCGSISPCFNIAGS